VNKSEKAKLASIVSEMIASFESSGEVSSWGEKILFEFPFISVLVEQYSEVQKIENIASSYNSYIVGMSKSYSGLTKSDRDVNNLGVGGCKGLHYVFDDYFCREKSLDPSCVESHLGSLPEEAKDMIKRLLADELFIEMICKSEDLTQEQKSLYKGQLITG